MIQAILFDFDGTIAYSRWLYLESINHALKVLGHVEIDWKNDISVLGMNDDELSRAVFPRAQRAEALAVAERYREENVTRTPLFDGMKFILEDLSEGNARLAIVTNRRRSHVMAILDAHGITNLFEQIICLEDVRLTKPSPEGILLAMNRMGLKEHEVIMVGDSANDIIAAHAAGIRAIAATWDRHACTNELAAHFPDVTAPFPTVILEQWTLYGVGKSIEKAG